LLALLRERSIERLYLPYVALQSLAEAARSEGLAPPSSLRDVIVAGERLRITPAIRAFFRLLPDCVLHNHYGPTETHVVAAHELSGDTTCWPELPPIGRPLPHVWVRIPGADTPTGGELLLGGGCLAAGYVGQPSMTAQHFSEHDGARWYHTGDRVRRNSAGELEYLGRLDEQIKIAGHRVEPGEVEALLCRRIEVAEAVVVAQDSHLVAHIVPRQAQAREAVLESVLADYCRGMLPAYLRPQHFVFHAALPTTRSGKIDRRALAHGFGTEAPPAWWDEASSLEGCLQQLWRQLLRLDVLEVSANLFDLGARSLDVVQVLTELRRHGHRVSVAQLYEHPTVMAQAALLGTRVQPHVPPLNERQRSARQRAALAKWSQQHAG
jgi:acyl-coenzyme A synthetase/AMP-(fatty) acid ligase/aryl carrier-like protein